jgi:phosphatidylinositol glycan class A protein
LLALQEMVEYQHLQDRVTFLGSVPHVNVASVLRQGSIFLNCSLTESFCIAILEAASCGLLVVSTNVGGVPEVLPEDDMIILCDASVDALVDGLRKAIERQQQESTLVRGHLKQQSLLPPVDAVDAHERITQMYSWHRVAVQTIHEIYDKIVVEDDADDDDAKDKNPSLVVRGGRRIYLPKESFPQRLMKYNDALGGGLSGFVVCVLALYVELWIRCVEILQPIDGIDVVPDLIPPLSPSQPAASMSGA